jgi:integrase
VKALILTGQRRDEVRCMMWSEVDIDRALWVLPAARNKGKREQEVPLLPAMVELLGTPRRTGPVFSLNGGRTTYAGWQSLKRFLDRESGVSGWTYHDIRRTVASGLAALHVPQDTIDRVLNHAKSPLAGIYNRHEYLSQKRQALQLWAERVAVIVGEGRDAANVVELRSGA